MPTYYRFAGEETPGRYVYSSPLLTVTHTPDFSMPFNVNAVSHIIFGILFVNTVAALTINYNEEKEKLEKEVDEKSEKAEKDKEDEKSKVEE